MTDEVGPFVEADEIHLGSAPLVRVLAQVRWDELTQFQDFEAKANALAELIQGEYPIRSQQREMQFEVGPQGVLPVPSATIHQLNSKDDSLRVYFAPTFLTLETASYSSRTEFVAKFESLLQHVSTIASIPRAVRVGFRYVNRIDMTTGFDELEQLVRPELLGGRNIQGLGSVVVRHTLSETLFGTSRGNLLTKWGILPVGGFMDPTIEPVNSPSWILDLDAFSETKVDFSPGALAKQVRELSSLGYGFFRWAVTPTFIERFEGEVQ